VLNKVINLTWIEILEVKTGMFQRIKGFLKVVRYTAHVWEIVMVEEASEILHSPDLGTISGEVLFEFCKITLIEIQNKFVYNKIL
jgi:hypothetical protein